MTRGEVDWLCTNCRCSEYVMSFGIQDAVFSLNITNDIVTFQSQISPQATNRISSSNPL